MDGKGYFGEELVEKLAETLLDPVKEYRNARSDEGISEFCFRDPKCVQWFENYRKALCSLETKEITLDRSLYWILITRAKIEVIAAIGGIDLMGRVCDKLEEHPENKKYHFASAFNALASGICGWSV
ncbi:MAG: hypothetical protein AB1327_05630 [Bacillota bacterium]|uniref:hypothetical protein n=1 Tax=Desulforudis sp. DRI-14 TaxID=3459793 RepID=UPI003482CB7D